MCANLSEMELELAKSYIAERKEKKKQVFESAKEMSHLKTRHWMKHRGKRQFLDFQDK